MKQSLRAILSGLLIASMIWGCKQPGPTIAYNEFSLYTAREVLDSTTNTTTLVPVVDHAVSIETDSDVLKTINILLDSLSVRMFNNLPIDALRIDERENGFKVVIIDLAEHENFILPDSLGHNRSWYEFFQGSLGGSMTTIILIESILQRNYPGPWIDAMEVHYQHEPIGDWDHIQLAGTIMRK